MEDQRLLKRLRCGDCTALCRIYEKYIDDLLTLAASLLSDINSAEDCVHDVFVGFASVVGSCNIQHNLKGYLISCVANRARDRLKKKQSHSRVSKDSEHLSTIGNPVKELIDYEESVRIFEALAEIPYKQREVFALHVQMDMKFREIAVLLGVSINTIQGRYRYAIEKLQKLLEKDNNHDVRK